MIESLITMIVCTISHSRLSFVVAVVVVSSHQNLLVVKLADLDDLLRLIPNERDMYLMIYT